MPVLQFDLKEYATYFDKLGAGGAMAATRRGAYSAALRALALMQRRTDAAGPSDPKGLGTGGAVNTGHFRMAWKATPLEDGAYLFNDAPYAGVIESGRRPGGRMPPSAAIARWAQRRLGLSEADAKAAAFLIARAIARRGLRGRQILSGSIGELRQMVNEEILRELATEMGRK